MRTAARLIAKQVVFFLQNLLYYRCSCEGAGSDRHPYRPGLGRGRDGSAGGCPHGCERRWNTDNILIMGDMNVDCKYASGRARESLTLRTDPRFTWLIEDDVDTTTTSTDCAYDRCVCAPLLTCSVSVNRRLFIGRASVWL